MKKWLIILLLLIGIFVLLVLGFFIWINANNYKPAQKELLPISQKQFSGKIKSPRMHLATWNIGYGGLGKEMDFFYDGGRQTRASLDKTNEYFSGILNILAKNLSIDIWMLQEVDRKAKRTYFIDEPARIEEVLSRHNACFATNYKVPFVAVPLTNPMGEVESGFMSLSVFTPTRCQRHAYPESVKWPNSLYLPDRCFIEMRIPIKNGKELVVINTHNTAYVSDQVLTDKERAVVRNLMITEYLAGNYVIAGGDWNVNPYNFQPDGDFNGHRFVEETVKFGKSFMPQDWQLAFDNKAPSNRHLDHPYTKGKTGTTTLDFFVLSPNIKLNQVITVDLGFEFSDHNPVFIDIELKGM